MPPTRIPTAEDFAPLSPSLTVSLVFPSPPESTTAILLLFHGLGDSEASFASFARSIALPGVLAVSVRGPAPLPPSLLGDDTDGPARHFHWGDDLTLAHGTGELDPDPGFKGAERLVMERLVGEVLVERCGWELGDVLLFGFGQGGSFALGLASRARMGKRVEEVTEEASEAEQGRGRTFKGVVSIGGPLPPSMIPTISAREKARTPVLVCHGSASEAVDEDAVETLKEEFADVKDVKWKRPDDDMPRSREEVLPMMEFFADRLRSGW
ncbi:Alpha/Beta hydrolase protein [Phialemonium atrogriseum]|uniref:Alpha/Beta hydrolase protein n=1 Tax=Phialemonium atrogriseum TaxID=1093897 RepID=A0AAJ0C5Q5_9PEZI|nr:Alpha/Beta hydrolase protein [Phialemonium atrogriseum]KAK1770664.1 Alpha/Beta hydrolase protein [Phialemonium atrogriseum]